MAAVRFSSSTASEPIVQAVVQTRLNAAIPARTKTIAALYAREVEMQRELRSTARQLVQVGLFDRRAMRASARQMRVIEARRDEEEARLGTGGGRSERVEASWEVRAVLIGGRT
jgi:hypothetical protein